jgi:ABC-type nitrate/sulfonate/bicarbonate transport system permease component
VTTETAATATGLAGPATPRRWRVPSALRRGLTSIVVLLAAWYLLVDQLALVPSRTLPPLTDVWNKLVELATQPYVGETLWGHAGDSLMRWGLGVAISVLIGVPLGMIMGWFRFADAVISPIFNALRSVPPLAWIPLAILWLGTGLVTEVALVFIAAFPPIVINAYHGARSIDRQIVGAARTTGAGSIRQLVQIVIPTELPQLISGLRVALGNGLMAVIAAELVSADSGLGFLIIRGQQDFQPDQIVVGMLMIALIGLTADTLLTLTTRPLLRWRNTDDH